MDRLYQCDDCGQSFWQTVERRSAPPPKECPICRNTGTPTAEALVWKSKEKREADQTILKMVDEGRGPGYNASTNAQLKSEEQVFRAMERGSIFRAECAASDLGVPVSEMSNLKITNMRDNVKPGESSAIVPLSNDGIKMREAARTMSFNPNAGGQIAPSAFAGQGTVINGKQVGTMVGPAAGSHGMNALGKLGVGHAQRAAQVASAGRLNKD